MPHIIFQAEIKYKASCLERTGCYMNKSEKRRRQLLNETRYLYSDRKGPPAVHPRYGAAYHKLYGEEDTGAVSTFGIRVFLCFMLFAAFVAMENNGIEVKHVNSDRVIQEITTDMDVAEVWKNL